MKATLIFAALIALVMLGGCSSNKTSATVPADPVASTDPNSRAKQLLKQFADAEDGPAWVQQNTFALSVFQNVTDPALKAEYDSKIAPLLVAKK